jgi:hypothetical protein
MRFSPISFLLGLAAAAILPVISRVARPLAVDATAAGLGLAEDVRRIIAEQMENVEDIVAEARARREELLTQENGHFEDASEAPSEEPATEETAPARGRRRSDARGRRHSA